MKTSALNTTQLVAALLAAGAIGGASVSAINTLHTQASAAVPAALVASAPISLPDFSQITERYGPAVVNISVSIRKASDTSSEAQSDEASSGGVPNDPFFEFFRRFQQGQSSGRSEPSHAPTHGQGSGFIVSSDGIILTNAHVVHDAQEVIVKLTDRREFRAKVLGADPKTDIAVLKIDAKDLPVVVLAKTNAVKVGEWVLAIGSPFGFENSVTAGVVSAKGRSLPDDSAVPFIQTDVAINPGNSGGPLFNARGEVVGINSQIYSRSGGYQGVSFAIPIDIATRVQSQIVATGKVEHARLGVGVQEVNQTFANSFKLETPEGALVSMVEKGSPADKAGLLPGDVIRQVNGRPIVSSGDLPAIIGMEAPGEKITLGIWRQGAAKELSARLGNAADKSTLTIGKSDADQQGKLGLALRPLQPDESKEVGVSSGLLVQQASGLAALAGVQAGDVLLSVNGTPVKSVEQVRALLAKSDKSVALLIMRGDSKIFVPINIG